MRLFAGLFPRSLQITLALVVVSALAACSKPASDPAQAGASGATPDTVYVNGAVYTVDANNSWAEAFAVKDGTITAVGTNADIKALQGAATKSVDLGGKMVMPGIHDMHTHALFAGEAHFFECSFPFTYTMDQIVEKVRQCAATTPKGQWIRGGQWAQELLATKNPPHRKVLDAISTDHPIYLGDSTMHDGWMNTKALELVGIKKGIPNPPGGVVDRDPNGEPNGIVHNDSNVEALQKLPSYTPEQYDQALSWAMAEMNKVGITSQKDALVDSHALRAYHDLDVAGKLTMNVGTHLAWRSSWTETREKELENIKTRAQFRSPHVNTEFIKIFLDGIPPSRTAAMLEPYLPAKGYPKDFKGTLLVQPEQLKADLIDLDKQGLTVKIHTTGDRAVQVALDAFEAARKANGMSNRRHEIAHAELIAPSDIPRFKALNVIAEMCPILWYRSGLVDVMATTVGEEKANHFWPTKSLLDAGAIVTYGSDWPSVVPNPSPWRGIESLVTRIDPDTNTGAPLWPEQAIDLASAVRIFTHNGAIALQHGDTNGSIEPGRAADFIVIDRNIFKVPIQDVSDTKVLSTVVGGKEVYKAAL